MRALTGLDDAVRAWLEQDDSVGQMYADIENFLLTWLPEFRDGQRSYVTVHGKPRLLETTPLMPELNTTLAESAALVVAGFVLVIALQFAGSRIAEQS